MAITRRVRRETHSLHNGTSNLSNMGIVLKGHQARRKTDTNRNRNRPASCIRSRYMIMLVAKDQLPMSHITPLH